MKRILTTTLLSAAIGLLSACSTSGGMTPFKVPVQDPEMAIRKLSMFGIESRYDEKESAVLVASDKEVRAARILSSANMLPNGSEAYGFAKESHLAQAAAEAAMIHRVELQHTLSETVAAMPSVDKAAVNLTPASRPYYYRFDKEDLAAKASVMVTTIGNRPLNEAEVMSIAQLIAGSTETLAAKNVFIQDTAGRHYPINEDWRQTYSIMQARANANSEAEQKVRMVLSAYKPMVSSTIEMKIGEEPTAKDKGEAEKPTAIYKETRVPDERYAIKPDFSRSTIAVTISEEFELSKEKLQEMKATISKATNIPIKNIELLQVPPIR